MQAPDWLHIRLGLGEVSEALVTRPCKICYFGNSVTVQKEGYRTVLHQLINEHSGQPHQAINAGIGGVGSLACAFFVTDFVLRHKPDVCFVECTTADVGGATPLLSIGPSVEGIMRQLLDHNIQVCLLHLYRSTNMQYDAKGVISIYEEIAERYGVPSINVHQAILNLIKNGTHGPDEICYDGIHTTPLGAGVFANRIFYGLKEILSFRSDAPRQFDAQLHGSVLESTSIVPATLATKNLVAETYKTGKFRNLIAYTELLPGQALTYVPAAGELVAVLVIADSESGVVATQTTKVESLIQLHDEWCDKPRLQVIILDRTVQQNEPFTLLLSDADTASRGPNTHLNPTVQKGRSLKVIGFLCTHVDNHYKKHNLWNTA